MDLNKRLIQMEFEREQAASGPVPEATDFEACGPPTWSESAWNAFRATHGRDPFSVFEPPPMLHTAPPWVFQRLGMRPPIGAR